MVCQIVHYGVLNEEVSARAHRIPALMGQALEEIVVRGTDIYAFAPMEDRDRAQVRITIHVFYYNESPFSWFYDSLPQL